MTNAMSEVVSPVDVPIAQVFFCDDVRHEVTGKVTLVGVYNHTMFVSIGGGHVPKLVAFLSFIYPLSMAGQTAEVTLLDRGNIMLCTQLPLPAPVAPAKIRDDQPPERFGAFNAPIELIGFAPVNGMQLRVTLSVGAAYKYESYSMRVVAPDPLDKPEPLPVPS